MSGDEFEEPSVDDEAVSEDSFEKFGDTVREALLTGEPKNQCCRNSLSCGIRLFAKKRKNAYSEEIGELCRRLEKIHQKKKKSLVDSFGAVSGFALGQTEDGGKFLDISGGGCAECFAQLLRGCYLSAGRMGNPLKSLYMELSMPNADVADLMTELLTERGIPPKRTVRRSEQLLYYKRTEAVGDVLNYMGASKAYFRLINAMIIKEYKINSNRRTNCDTSNINKTVNASARQVAAINAISEAGMMAMLSRGIRETALLRLENPEVTLEELIALHPYRITKSGVNHRLQKAVSFAELNGLMPGKTR
ncbi:MAG: DNA-binding protein WhiA [Clostridia bacterium]|nr:DNA-binding protein WhiA [Clostridia bacterium]